MKKPSTTTIVHSTVLVLGVIVFTALIWMVMRETKGDDIYFRNLNHRHPELLEYLGYRYHSWSARLIPEIALHTFSAAPLMYWKIVSVMSFFASTVLLSAYARLAAPRNTAQRSVLHTAIVAVFCVSFIALMGEANVTKSVLWVTGSMNYLWLTPFFLLALYPPLYFVVRQRWPHWSMSVAGLISALLISASNEQAGLFTTTLLCIIFAHFFITHWHEIRATRTVTQSAAWLTGFLFSSFSGLIYLLAAPGNQKRLDREYEKFMFEADSISLLQRIDGNIRWLVEAVVNQMGALWFILLALLIALAWKQYSAKKQIQTAAIAVLLTSTVIPLLLSTQVTRLRFFSAQWLADPPLYTSLIATYWLAIIVVTALAPLVIYRAQHKTKGRLLSLSLVGFYASIAVIWLSPTMYGSGWRTLFIPSIILTTIIIFLLEDLFNAYPKRAFLILASLITMATVSSINLFAFLLQ